ELVPNTAKPGSGMMAMPGMGGPKKATGTSFDGNDQPLLLETPGKTPASLVGHMHKRYGEKPDRQKIGLDEATFKALDANGDGVLDAEELAAFVKRTPDLELVMRLRVREAGATGVEGKPTPVPGKLKLLPSVALLDLGRTRLELR